MWFKPKSVNCIHIPPVYINNILLYKGSPPRSIYLGVIFNDKLHGGSYVSTCQYVRKFRSTYFGLSVTANAYPQAAP